MEEISNLLDLFKDRNPPRDFAHLFRSAPIKSGLFRFLAILDSEARLGLESCSASQIDAVIFAAKLLVGSSLSILAESGESLVLVILEKSVEFCLSILEKLKFDDADFSLQPHDMMEALRKCQVFERQVCVNWFKLRRWIYGFRLPDEHRIRRVALGNLAVSKGEEVLCVLNKGAVHEVLRVQITSVKPAASQSSQDLCLLRIVDFRRMMHN